MIKGWRNDPGWVELSRQYTPRLSVCRRVRNYAVDQEIKKMADECRLQILAEEARQREEIRKIMQEPARPVERMLERWLK